MPAYSACVGSVRSARDASAQLADYPDRVRNGAEPHLIPFAQVVAVDLEAARQLRTEREFGQIMHPQDALSMRPDHCLCLFRAAPGEELSGRTGGPKNPHTAHRHDIQTKIE